VWRITVSDRFDDAGKRRRITRTVAGSKRDAERELTRMLRDRDERKLADGRQPLSVYLSETGWGTSRPCPSVDVRSLRRHASDTPTQSATCPGSSGGSG
jgi:hypothetical protein